MSDGRYLWSDLLVEIGFWRGRVSHLAKCARRVPSGRSLVTRFKPVTAGRIDAGDPVHRLSGWRGGLRARTMPYWEYLRWVAFVGGAVGVWRYLPLTVIRLVAAFTRDERRHKQCMEVLRLARRDASRIPSYVAHAGEAVAPMSGAERRAKRSRGKRVRRPALPPAGTVSVTAQSRPSSHAAKPKTGSGATAA